MANGDFFCVDDGFIIPNYRKPAVYKIPSQHFEVLNSNTESSLSLARIHDVAPAISEETISADYFKILSDYLSNPDFNAAFRVQLGSQNFSRTFSKFSQNSFVILLLLFDQKPFYLHFYENGERLPDFRNDINSFGSLIVY